MAHNKTNQYRAFFLSFFAAICLTINLLSCINSEPLFECNDPLGCFTISPDEEIKIGVLQALSGKISSLGEAQVRGLSLALDKRDNEILGHPISLQIEDTGCTPEGGANTALKIIADPQMIAVFGSTCSGAAATASKAISDAGLTMISGNNSAPFLTSIAGKHAPNWQPGYFRTAPNEQYAGNTAAEYAFTVQNLRKAAIINDKDIYTTGLTNSFKKAFVELGGEIVLETSVNKGETQMSPVLEAVVHSKAELLFFPLFQAEGGLLLTQARATPELNDLLLIASGALIEKNFLEAVGLAAKGMCFVAPALAKGPGVEKLTSAYIAKYHEEPTVSYFLNAYDAAEILLNAIKQASVSSPDGTLHIGRQKIRDTLYATRSFQGVTGTLSCDQFGDCATPSFHIIRLDDPAFGLKGLEENIVFPTRSK